MDNKVGVVDFTKLWIGDVFETESEIYSFHEQNLQNMKKSLSAIPKGQTISKIILL